MEQQRFVRRNITIEELKQVKSKRRKRITVWLSVLISVAALSFVAVCFAVFLKVKTININGNSRYDNETVLKTLPFSYDDNIYSFKSSDAIQDLEAALPFISDVEIHRNLPSTVEVNITESKPVLATVIGTDAYLFSDKLKVLDRVPQTSLTSDIALLKTGSISRCIVGETAAFLDTRTYDDTVELYKELQKNAISEHIHEIDMTSRFDIYLKYDDRFTVYLGDMDNCDVKIAFLVGIISHLYDTDKGTIDVSNHLQGSFLPS